MPNHVTHKIAVLGPPEDIAAFKKRCILPDLDKDGRKNEDGSPLIGFDFDSLIPMPEYLRNTPSDSIGEIGYEVWYQNSDEWKVVLGYPWVANLFVEAGFQIFSRENLQKVLYKNNPKYKEMADRIHRNVIETGFKNWYDWSRHNWGTKWNSYSFKEFADGKTYRFSIETAWTSPIPVFEKLVAEFPTLILKISSFDEGENFACEGFFYGENCAVLYDEREVYHEVEREDQKVMNRIRRYVYRKS